MEDQQKNKVIASSQQQQDAQQKQILDWNTKFLESAPRLSGHRFSGRRLTCALQFVDGDNVDVTPVYERFDRETLPDIIPGTYQVTQTSPGHWEVRITTLFKGTNRVDTYTLLPSDRDANLFELLGGKQPYPQLVEGHLTAEQQSKHIQSPPKASK
jgi:hypothetical protein